MQKLGSDIPWREAVATTIVGELKNPYTGVAHAAMEPWENLYEENCAACHGDHFEGDIGPELVGADLEENYLFEIIYNGIPDSGMPPYASLGADKVWKLVNFVKYYNQDEDSK
jgi:cytochrome c oxidase cbb3-type subunit 2